LPIHTAAIADVAVPPSARTTTSKAIGAKEDAYRYVGW
jgi:hypothetical protein